MAAFAEYMVQLLNNDNLGQVSNLTMTLFSMSLKSFLNSVKEFFMPRLVVDERPESVAQIKLCCKILDVSMRHLCIEQAHVVLAKVLLWIPSKNGSRFSEEESHILRLQKLNFFLGLINDVESGDQQCVELHVVFESCWCSLLADLAVELGQSQLLLRMNVRNSK